MAMTIAQAAMAYQKNDPTLAGIAATFVQNASVLQYMPFSNVVGQTTSFVRESALPTTAARALNAAYTASDATLAKASADLKIYGGKFEADRALIKMEGESNILVSQNLQQKSLARKWQDDFFTSDGSSNTITGLESTIAAGQKIPTATNGDPLSLSLLEEAIIKCTGQTKKIFVSTELYLLLQKKSRTSANVNYLPDQFGRFMLTYAGYEVVLAGKDASNAEILGFDETQGTSDVTTSLYVVGFGGDGTSGIQSSDMVRYVLDKESPAINYDLEWINNYIIRDLNSAWRVHGITNDIVINPL